MKLRDLAFVFVRLLALYIFIQGLDRILHAIQYTLPPKFLDLDLKDENYLLMFALATGLVLIVSSVILWGKANRLVRWIVPHPEASFSGNLSQHSELYAVGISLIGIVLFVNSIPHLIMAISQLIFYNETPFGFGFRRDLWIQMVGNGMKLFLSLALIFGAQSIQGLIMKIRNLGAKKV